MQRFKREFQTHMHGKAAAWRANEENRFTYNAVYEREPNNRRDLCAGYLNAASHFRRTGHWSRARAAIECAKTNRLKL